MSGRRRVASFALWLVSLLILLLALRGVSLRESLRAIAGLDASAVALLVALNAAALLVFTLRWWIVLRGLGRPVALFPASLYRLAAFGLSYFTPGPQVGGEPLQVLLVERRQNVPRDAAIASVGLDRLVEAVVNLGYLGAALSILLHPRALGLVAGAAAAVPLLYLGVLACGRRPLVGLFDRLPFEGARALVRGSEMAAGRFCRERPGHLGLALLASVLSFGLILAEYWLMARFLGMPLSLRGLVLGVTAARIAYLLFFPAALGVLEAGQIAALSTLGFAPELGVSLSLQVRARDVILAAIGLSWGVRVALAPLRAPEGNPRSGTSTRPIPGDG